MTRHLRLLWPRLCALTLILIPRIALAANDALGDADAIEVGTTGDGDIKDIIINIVKKILTYVAVLAVAMIVFAGIWLIVGSYDESSKEKAKKMIIYTIVGLLVIMLAQAIVTFVLSIN